MVASILAKSKPTKIPYIPMLGVSSLAVAISREQLTLSLVLPVIHGIKGARGSLEDEQLGHGAGKDVGEC